MNDEAVDKEVLARRVAARRSLQMKKQRKLANKQRWRRPSYFRILPVTMLMTLVLLGVKVSDLYRGTQNLQTMLEVRPAYAADDMAAEEGQATSEEMAEDGAATEEEEAAEAIKVASLEENPKPEPRREFSQIELDILQSLAERRDELKERTRELDLKEKLLEGTELRINDKINEINALKQEVQGLLEQYNEQEKAKISGLVKIYESMKPKDAATIFNELDMPILLEVVDQMSSRKVAPVLAKMNPMKAKGVTEELAEMRRLKAIPKSVKGM